MRRHLPLATWFPPPPAHPSRSAPDPHRRGGTTSTPSIPRGTATRLRAARSSRTLRGPTRPRPDDHPDRVDRAGVAAVGLDEPKSEWSVWSQDGFVDARDPSV